MRITINGEDLLARNLDTARLRDIVELQRQTGWKMKDLRDHVTEADILGPAISMFLTLACYGRGPLWEEILDGDIASMPFKKDAIDEVVEAEGGGVPDPQLPAQPDSSPGAETPAAAPARPRPTRSTGNRGSQRKSTAGSSTSATSSPPSPPL